MSTIVAYVRSLSSFQLSGGNVLRNRPRTKQSSRVTYRPTVQITHNVEQSDIVHAQLQRKITYRGLLNIVSIELEEQEEDENVMSEMD